MSKNSLHFVGSHHSEKQTVSEQLTALAQWMITLKRKHCKQNNVNIGPQYVLQTFLPCLFSGTTEFDALRIFLAKLRLFLFYYT